MINFQKVSARKLGRTESLMDIRESVLLLSVLMVFGYVFKSLASRDAY